MRLELLHWQGHKMDDEKTQREQDYLITFSTDAGKRVLEDIRKGFQDKLSHCPGDPYETAYREGRRAVYLSIVSLMDRAKYQKVDQRQVVAE